MKNKIAFALLGLMLTGCLQDYPEQTDNDGNGKACNLVKYVSNISLQFNSHSSLPARISGSVNGVSTINECTLGNDTETYTLVRNANNSLTVVLWVDRSAAMSNTFFNDDGTPKAGGQLQLVLTGRQNCSDSPVQIYQTTRVLNWQPVYSNSNKACSPSGYTAIITN